MSNNKYDIYGRIFRLIVEVIKTIKLFPKTEENKVIIGQLLRSVTSMGANAEEADGVSSNKDFLHCFTIVRKEGKETLFWMKLLNEINYSLEEKLTPQIKECSEIISIVSKILINSRNK